MPSNIKQNISKSHFWDDLYIKNKDKWNLKSVTPAFVDWENENHKNRNINVCVPGCGKGSDALYFASLGYNVYAIDFSKYAVNYLRKKSQSLNIDINIIHADFFNIKENYLDRFDLIVEYTFYCAFEPSKRNEYVEICSKILKSKGKFVGIFLPLDAVTDTNPPFKVSTDEIIKSFSKQFILKQQFYPHNSINKRRNNEILIEFSKK